ncbi:PAS domain-containing protein [Leptolyngbya sp. AN02str]|uniref:PAS domain-containing protein n=1 Tax=Leptolyngbya sp. AN02str TaxID=3423363 RepID=UPI003D31FAA2
MQAPSSNPEIHLLHQRIRELEAACQLERQRYDAVAQEQCALLEWIQRSPLPTLETDTNLTITLWNPAAEHAFGYPQHDVIGRSLLDVIHTDHHAELDALIPILQSLQSPTRCLPTTLVVQTQSAQSISCTWHSTYRTGGDRWQLMLQPQDTQVEPVPSGAVACQTSNALLQLVLDTLPQRVFWKDVNLRYLGGNKLFAQDAGLDSPDALIGLTDFDVSWGNAAIAYQAHDRDVLASNAPKMNYEEQMTYADGSLRWVKTSKLPLRNEQGEVIGVFGTYEDVTQQRQIEIALQQREEFLRSIYDGTAEIMFAVNYTESGEFRYESFNLACERFTQVTTAEAFGKTPIETFGETMGNHVQRNYERCIAADAPITYEEKVQFTHSIEWTMTTLSPLRDSTGRIFRLVGTASIITDRKQTEAELERSQEMLRLVIDNIPQRVMWKDRNSVYLGCNQSHAKLTGFVHPNAIVGKTDFDLPWLSEQAAAYREEDQQLMESDTPLYRIVEPQRLSSGELRWVEANKIPIHDAQGEVAGLLITLEDITERKQAEEALKASAQDLRTLFNSIHDAIFIHDLDLTLLDVNTKMLEMFGVSYDEALTMSIVEDYSSADNPFDDLPPLWQRVLDGETCQFAWRVKRPHDGTVFDVEVVLQRVSLSNRSVVLANVRDISDRKRAQEAVQQSQEMLQLVIDTMPQRIFWKDKDLVYLGCNISQAKFSGLSHPKQIVGLSDYDLPEVGDRAERYRARDRQVLAANRTEHAIYETVDEVTQQAQWIAVNKIPLHDSQGNVMGLLGMVEDITERKQTEAALLQSAEQLQQQAQHERLINQLIGQIRNSLDIQQILRVAVHEMRVVLGIDSCMFAWYQPEADPPYWDVVEESCFIDMPRLLGSHVPNAHIEPISDVVLQGEIVRVDDTFTLSDRKARVFYQRLGYRASLALPVCTHSGAVGVLGCSSRSGPRIWLDDEVELVQTVVDQLVIALNQAELYDQSRTKAQELQATLQELQRTQTHLIQSEKMSSLGQLVAGVAHEINNPVNFISGNLNYASDYTQDLLRLIELYRKHYPAAHPEIQEEADAVDLDFLMEDLPKLLNSMRVGSERIQAIVASLRTFSRMDEAEFKAVDIHEGIDSTLMILQNRLKAKSNRPAIEVMREYHELPLVECYAGQLNQVFMNILSNAIDALEERDEERSLDEITNNPSHLWIKTEMIQETVASGTVESKVKIHIADNGPGISSKNLQRLFDPFFTTKPVGQGTGMGLSISYQIVTERHGGTLECISSPGQGAEFIITIPIQQI